MKYSPNLTSASARPVPAAKAAPSGAAGTGTASAPRPFRVAQDPAAHYTVYMLTSPEGRRYIGSTGRSLHQAIGMLRYPGTNRALEEDISLFGLENFDVQVLCEKLLPDACLTLRDRFIRAYGTADPAIGYNRMTGSRIPEPQPGPAEPYDDADAAADREAMEALKDFTDRGDEDYGDDGDDGEDPVPTTVLLVLPGCLLLLTDDDPAA